MSPLDFLNHLMNFAAPALFLSVLLSSGARLVWRRKPALLSWPRMVLLQSMTGVAVLVGGLVLTGQDGRMLTYAALVFTLASSQWLMSCGWKSGATSR